MVYRGAPKFSAQQMRAAIEALPYENPKLSAVALTSMSEHYFALRLERAIARSEGARMPKLLEARVEPTD
jgi:hypothetical protein